MRRVLLYVGGFLLVVSVVFSTGAFAAGDEAVDGVHLNPADSPNGQTYTEFDAEGDLRLDLSRMNDRAVTTIDSVFTVSSSRETVRVWVVPGTDAVTFYRMDTRDPITSPSQAVELSREETVEVGVRVDSRHSDVQTSEMTVHARYPSEDDSPPDQGGPGDGTGPGTDPGGPSSPTPGDPPATPGTPATPTPTPSDPITTPEPPSPTPDPDPSTETPPEPEVGGFPWLPLAALVLGVVLLPLLFFAYRRFREGGVRIAADSASGLGVSPGRFDAERYEVAEDSVTFAFAETEGWQEREEGTAVAFDGVATLENTTQSALAVGALLDGGERAGVQLVADGASPADLLAEPVTVPPGDRIELSVVLPADHDGHGTIAIRCETDPLSTE